MIREAKMVNKSGKSKQDVLERMCNIQKEFDDAVIFRVGIKEGGRIIDIIGAENTFNKKLKEELNEIEVEMPEKPEYVG